MWVLSLFACSSEPIDRDGDGSEAGVDCDDEDPGLHPRATRDL